MKIKRKKKPVYAVLKVPNKKNPDQSTILSERIEYDRIGKELYLVTVTTSMDDIPIMITASKQAALGKARSVRIKEIDEATAKAGLDRCWLFFPAVTTFKRDKKGWSFESTTPYDNRYIEAFNESLSQKRKMKIRRKKK